MDRLSGQACPLPERPFSLCAATRAPLLARWSFSPHSPARRRDHALPIRRTASDMRETPCPSATVRSRNRSFARQPRRRPPDDRGSAPGLRRRPCPFPGGDAAVMDTAPEATLAFFGVGFEEFPRRIRTRCHVGVRIGSRRVSRKLRCGKAGGGAPRIGETPWERMPLPSPVPTSELPFRPAIIGAPATLRRSGRRPASRA